MLDSSIQIVCFIYKLASQKKTLFFPIFKKVGNNNNISIDFMIYNKIDIWFQCLLALNKGSKGSKGIKLTVRLAVLRISLFITKNTFI